MGQRQTPEEIRGQRFAWRRLRPEWKSLPGKINLYDKRGAGFQSGLGSRTAAASTAWMALRGSSSRERWAGWVR